jgi:hypothetical protein
VTVAPTITVGAYTCSQVAKKYASSLLAAKLQLAVGGLKIMIHTSCSHFAPRTTRLNDVPNSLELSHNPGSTELMTPRLCSGRNDPK